jgi:hypothetical protein
MTKKPASSVGYTAERLWENKKFHALINEGRSKLEKDAKPAEAMTTNIRVEMKDEGFVLSPFWDQLITSLIIDPDYPFVEVAYTLSGNSYIPTSDPVYGDILTPDVFPEAKMRDKRRAVEEMSTKMQMQLKEGSRVKKEQPWESKELGREAYELRKSGKTYREIADIFSDRGLQTPDLHGWYGEEDVRTLISTYKNRTGNQ